MEELTTIEIDKENLKFSAAHFTIFSGTERERLHGHNFGVHVEVTVPLGSNGMQFSYGDLKAKLRQLCDELDEYTLIAADSPHLSISEQAPYYCVDFNGDIMQLLQSDTLLLPVRNTTVEEFARYLKDRLTADQNFMDTWDVRSLKVKVSSGPGQKGGAVWTAPTSDA
jgi:6-pyruvoyltetrahydropterin/6-carboxytetrahydropterin synthase